MTARFSPHAPRDKTSPMPRDPLAYHLTLHAYGTRLHGDGKGSVDRLHSRFGEPVLPANPQRARFERSRMKAPPLTLDRPLRECLQKAVLGVCDHRGWLPHCLHLRTTHLHVVVSATATPPERVMNDFKAYGTRGLRNAGLIAAGRPVWSRHGSTEYLFESDEVRRAVRYVWEEQGAALDPAPIVADEYRWSNESRDRQGEPPPCDIPAGPPPF